jgi:hypothetical protein
MAKARNKIKCKPTKWIRLTMSKFDDKHRWEYCRHRDTCLEVAALDKWDGMSCYWCPQNPRGKEKGDG